MGLRDSEFSGVPRYFRGNKSAVALEGIEEQQKIIAKEQKCSTTINIISLVVIILTFIVGAWSLLHAYNLI